MFKRVLKLSSGTASHTPSIQPYKLVGNNALDALAVCRQPGPALRALLIGFESTELVIHVIQPCDAGEHKALKGEVDFVQPLVRVSLFRCGISARRTGHLN